MFQCNTDGIAGSVDTNQNAFWVYSEQGLLFAVNYLSKLLERYVSFYSNHFLSVYMLSFEA